MTEVTDMAAIDAVYREFFSAPYPNRSSAAVAALVVPGMKLEIVAYAVIANQAA
jgi:enamine deaminase RidA (YjgF/YER057c/UK114 family)